MTIHGVMGCLVCGNFKRPVSKNENVWSKSVTHEQILHQAIECHTCSIITRGINGCLNQHHLMTDTIIRVELQFIYQNVYEFESEIDDKASEKQGEGNEESEETEKEEEEEEVDDDDDDDDDFNVDTSKNITLFFKNGSNFVVEIFSLLDENCACPEVWDDMICYNRTSPKTDSDQAFNIAKSWISECIENHPSCNREQNNPSKPARLVHVGSEFELPRVVDVTDSPEFKSYLCLSHCWGLEQIITTTTPTLTARKEGINLAEFSQTFLDAIMLTRKLNYTPYIWIDSLCIIQNSAEDWFSQSRIMHNIYANAVITIAATASSSGSHGLYRSTPDFCVQSVPTDYLEYELYFRRKIEHPLRHDPDFDDQFPLLSRGWVWQERLLSARVLHFGPAEIFFECRTSLECECGGITGYGDIEQPAPKFSFDKLFQKETTRRESKFVKGKAWRTVVSEYSTLLLTYEKDKLPALAGIANQVVDMSKKDMYMFGLLKNSIIEDLCWQSGRGGKKIVADKAPTWSWASVNHSIYYNEDEYWLDPVSRLQTIATITAHDNIDDHSSRILTLTSKISVGTLQYGRNLLPLEACSKPRAQKWDDTRYYVTLDRIGMFEFEPDYRIDSELGRQSVLYWVALLKSFQNEDKPVKGIILKKALLENGHYERVGYLEIPFATSNLEQLDDVTILIQ